jgi:mannose/cellobiose epimerase-like protein (N-acyl-D-glucosamine 2-epimerase family)
MLNDTIERVRAWVFDTALPFWAERGIDRNDGGYVEYLDMQGNPVDPGYKRIRVIGRQLYVFSHAAIMGWEPGLELARHGFTFLTQNAWLKDGTGWARRVSKSGQIIDATPDLYDDAFALFSLGWYYRASGDPAALDWAFKTVEAIQATLRHESGIGFLHEKPASGPRQQNPHMHLLEAALACQEAFPDHRFEALGKEITALFDTHLFDHNKARLPEYFDEQMRPLQSDIGRITEPGHQLEWAWILANANRLLGVDTQHLVSALIGSAEKDGVDSVSYVTYNQVRDDGLALDKGSRTWPNTERIKGHIAAFEMFGTDPGPAIIQSTNVLFQHCLDRPIAGTWIDAFTQDGTPTWDKIPTSSLYHVFLAFAEILRVSDKLER